jgi:hypothetical protein
MTETTPDILILGERIATRDLTAWLYLAPAPRPDDHRALLRVLLQLTPESAAQIGPLGC